ncbi:MAG: hypothetical protein LBS97_06105 [Treponema sp.]|jgi:hypothetical protein|nr:hypothetical protein [Treponema sp.]
MRFPHFLRSLLVFYELARFIILCVFRPEPAILDLPLSWFAGAPLLVFPPALAALYWLDSKNAPIYMKLFVLVKLVSAPGLISYMGIHLRTMPGAILVILLSIDVILLILLFFKNMRKNDVISD